MTEHNQEEQRGPDQEPRTGGMALSRGYNGWHTTSPDCRGGGCTPFLAIPLAEAEALYAWKRLAEDEREHRLALAEERNQLQRDRDEWKASRELQKACADALRAQAEALIDPNDPAVREALDRILIPGQQNHDDVVDRVLAALRGAKFVPPATQRREPDGNSDTGAMREPSGGTNVFRSKEGPDAR